MEYEPFSTDFVRDFVHMKPADSRANAFAVLV